MNNPEWYELVVGIHRRTGIKFINRRTGIITRQIDYFAGVELDAGEAAKVDNKDWSLEDLPDDYRSAIDELLERMPQIDLKREFGEVFLAARDIGWIEAMAKQAEWWSLQQSQNSKKKAGPARKEKADKRHGKLALEYRKFIGQGKTDLEARNAIIDDRKNKKKKTRYDLSALSRILTEQKVR